MQFKMNGIWLIQNSPNYESGTNGPLESDLLLARDGNHWWDDIQ